MGLGPKRLFLCCLLMLAAAPALASPQAEFDDQLANALAQYRDASYQTAPTHSNKSAGQEALQAFLASWSRLRDRWQSAAPPRYADDPGFATSLNDIAEIGRETQFELTQDHLPQAHDRLRQVRALLADLRHRNGVALYLDALEAFDDVLAETADLGLDSPNLAPEQALRLTQQTAVLSYLMERLYKQAPARLSDDPVFLDQLEELNRQIIGLSLLIPLGRCEAVTAALADLRRRLDKLMLAYG